MTSVILFHDSTALGGAELHLLNIIKALNKLNISTYFITEDKGPLLDKFKDLTKEQLIVDLPYPSKPLSWLRIIPFKYKLKKFLKKISGPKIFLSGDVYSLWAMTLLKKDFNEKTRFISIWQGEFSFNESCINKWIRYGANQADILVSSSLIASYINKKNILKNKICVLNPTIDTTLFNYNTYKKEAIRKELNLPYNEQIALYVGRVGEGKGQFWLIKEFISNPDIYKKWILVLVGPANNENKDILNKLLNQDTKKRVYYIPTSNEIYKYLAAADLYLHTGIIQESFGITIAESIIMKLPIISTYVGIIKVLFKETSPNIFKIKDRDKITNLWRYQTNESLQILKENLPFNKCKELVSYDRFVKNIEKIFLK